MTQKDKELLMKDLSARLLYGVKLDFYSAATDEHIVCTLLGIEPEGDKPVIAKVDCGAFMFPQEHIKPYLRPMSSMTEEEKKEFSVLAVGTHLFKGPLIPSYDTLDWLNAHHFDYRNLVERGLAIAVTEENNPYK